MPILSDVIDNGYIVRQVVKDPWTTDDLIKAGDFEKKHIDGVAHSVHLLVNFSDCRSIPGDAWMMRRVPSTKHERLGYMVFAGTQKWLQLIMSVILRFMGFNRFRFFETEREARNFLHGQIPKEEMPAE